MFQYIVLSYTMSQFSEIPEQSSDKFCENFYYRFARSQ